jgi:UDP-GlcNAc:undecaprenyl-phosphate GlcNAc-1-phosphate transferase
MLALLFSLIVSLMMIKIVIYTSDLHAVVSSDHDVASIQKMHEHPVPRIGGLAIFVSMVFVALYGANSGANWSSFYAGLITSLFFIFIGGLTEDLSKAVSPWIRIGFMTFGSRLCFICRPYYAAYSLYGPC